MGAMEPSDRVARALADLGLPVVVDPDVLAGHCVDWTGRWSGPALAMVRPRSTQEVAAVLAVARRLGIPVQVQGGNTGLVGGSVPDRPAVLLVTTGLDQRGPVDPEERTVVVGAGVTAAAVAAHAGLAGLRLGVDLAARDSATIGGMVATNAGGIGVIAHGMMRDQVRGVTAVLADGRLVDGVLRPRKDNAGLDLSGLLVGSEGTLGVITRVELSLHPRTAPASVALLAVGSLAEAVAVTRSVQSSRGAGELVLAAEVVDAPGVALAVRALGVPDPLPPGAPWLLLLEVADGATGDAFAPVADHVLALATDGAHRRRLWSYRERQTELYAALPGTVDKLDVSLRLGGLDDGVAAIRRVAAGSPHGSAQVGIFGHALDGNLHVQLVGVAPDTAARVLAEVAARGGSISAEHGIGRLKAEHLHLARSADEIAWMRQIRATADPAGLLNPGVLLPPGPAVGADQG
jgi:FAD/FMN-containing dehydrogenase